MPICESNGEDILLWKDEHDHFWAGPLTVEGRTFFTKEGVPEEVVAVEIVAGIVDFMEMVPEQITIGVLMEGNKVGRVTKNPLQ